MRRRAIRIAGACVLAATLAVSAAACGNDNKKSACDRLQQTITQVGQNGTTQNNDPNGVAQAYYNSAMTIRQEGQDADDGDVETAANDAASALEQLGQQLRTGNDRGPQVPDSASLLNAGERIRSACDD